jgi:hypothetical protein
MNRPLLLLSPCIGESETTDLNLHLTAHYIGYIDYQSFQLLQYCNSRVTAYHYYFSLEGKIAYIPVAASSTCRAR